MKRRVVVTGMGLVTPCGHTVGETWSALMSGRSGVGYIEKFDTEKFSVKIGAEVKGFDPLKFIEKKEARKMGTFIHFAVAAADEAVYGAGLVERGQKLADRYGEEAAYRIGTYISSGIGDF
ncbi:MAG TPA: beta-ketoacyl synthase N-terminal-like domain-containing protein, partial [Pyrinomonadaceae bacterium]